MAVNVSLRDWRVWREWSESWEWKFSVRCSASEFYEGVIVLWCDSAESRDEVVYPRWQ
jgi:hypothetical protein